MLYVCHSRAFSAKVLFFLFIWLAIAMSVAYFTFVYYRRISIGKGDILVDPVLYFFIPYSGDPLSLKVEVSVSNFVCGS